MNEALNYVSDSTFDGEISRTSISPCQMKTRTLVQNTTDTTLMSPAENKNSETSRCTAAPLSA